MIIKLATYTFMTTAITVNHWEPVVSGETCEIAGLQSPYLKQIDNPSVDTNKYTPIIKCDLDNIDKEKYNKALLQCIKPQNTWFKI